MPKFLRLVLDKKGFRPTANFQPRPLASRTSLTLSQSRLDEGNGSGLKICRRREKTSKFYPD